MRRRHPKIIMPLALRLSRFAIWQLIVFYLALNLVLCLIFTAVFRYSEKGNQDFPSCLASAFGALWTTSNPLSDPNANGPLYYAGAVAATILSVLLPILLLGAFVFKLFQQDPIVWRKTISIINYRHFGPTMIFRIYNGTKADLANLRFSVVARITSEQPPSLGVNYSLKILYRNDLVEESPWIVSDPGVPLELAVPLLTRLSLPEVISGDSIQFQDATDRLVAKADVEIIVMIVGTSLVTGESFTSIARYPVATTITEGQPQDIDVRKDQRPNEWRGWDNFEGSQDIYLFAYGSMVNGQSLSQTLGHPVEPEEGPFPAMLDGWTRAWNVGSDKTSHPERIVREKQTGLEYGGMLAYLGLVESAGKACNGVVVRMTRRDLWTLADRERNYYREDVTSCVTWEGKPDHCLVFTFLPTALAKGRLDYALHHGQRIVLRHAYRELVERSFTDLGPSALRLYRESTPESPFEVLDVETSVSGDVLGLADDWMGPVV